MNDLTDGQLLFIVLLIIIIMALGGMVGTTNG